MSGVAHYEGRKLLSVDAMTKTIDKVTHPLRVSVTDLASTYEAGTYIERHAHREHQIVHAISGVMRVLARDATWVVPPGRGLWVPASVEHEIRCINLVEMRTVYLSGDHPAFRNDVQVVGISALMREIIVRFSEECDQRQVPHLTALLLDEIAAMEVEPFRLPSPQNSRIAELCTQLRDNPSNHRSLTEWASLLGFSPRNLMRHIHSETGMSFREFRRQARVLAALERLSVGQSVTTVALDVGFDSPSAFAFAFRSVTGKTPRHYLKREIAYPDGRP